MTQTFVYFYLLKGVLILIFAVVMFLVLGRIK